jgi:uncharacterized repeat protein (TIGR03803 family)
MLPSTDASALLQASNGLLYGIARTGGTYNSGVLYSYNITTGKDSILIDFAAPGVPFGYEPYTTGYVEVGRGTLITPVDSGGAYGMGTLISYDMRTGNFVKLFDFSGTDGAYPTADLIAVENRCEFMSPLDSKKLGVNTSVSGIVSVSGQNFPENAEISIFNMTGQEIYKGRYYNNMQINLSAQPKGIYLYRVMPESGNELLSAGKFIMQ